MDKPSNGASIEEKEKFIEYVLECYQETTPKIIRNRLIFARMMQDSYVKLLKYLFPEIVPKCANIDKNKVLQLFEIYKRIYSLTIESWNEEGDLSFTTEIKENIYFEQELINSPIDAFGIDAYTLYASILPSYIPVKENISECANVLSYIFEHSMNSNTLSNYANT